MKKGESMEAGREREGKGADFLGDRNAPKVAKDCTSESLGAQEKEASVMLRENPENE